MNTVILPEIDVKTEVLAAQKGSKEAFERLMSQFRLTIYAVVLRKVRRRDVAEDVTQEVCMTALKKIQQLETPEAFPGWIRRIASRLAINHVIRKSDDRTHSLDEMGYIGERASMEAPELLIAQEARDDIFTLVTSKLRELDKFTLLAFYWEGLSLIEMSERFDSPIGTIKRRLHTARHRLKDLLEEGRSENEVAA